jgi:hypothetical protein
MEIDKNFVALRFTNKSIMELLDKISVHFGHKDTMDYINKRVAFKKEKDNRYKHDNKSLTKRIATDAYSEAMLYKFSGGKFKPNFEVGQSKKYNEPDFRHIGLNMGLKTVQGFHAHLVKKEPEYPELMTRIVKMSDHVEYQILGVATVALMKKYSAAHLVKNYEALWYKLGFNEYEKLHKIYCFDDLWRIQ